GCSATGTRPFCDGTNSNLPGGYATDDPDSPENRRIEAVPAGTGPAVQLDGQCYVFSPAPAALLARDTMHYCPAVSPAMAALVQSPFYAEVAHGSSPIVSAEGRP